MLTFLMVIENIETRDKLEEIYIRYHKEMFCIAIGILNNTHDAQDTVQTSILKLTPYIEKIDDVNCNKTKNLIVTIIRNTAIDIYRHKKKHPFIQLEDQIVDQARSLDELVIRLSDAEWLSGKLAELKMEYAEVLTLKYYYEFEDVEIAELLSISYGNVRIRLNRAKNALRKLMEEDQQMNLYRRKCTNESKQ